MFIKSNTLQYTFTSNDLHLYNKSSKERTIMIYLQKCLKTINTNISQDVIKLNMQTENFIE